MENQVIGDPPNHPQWKIPLTFFLKPSLSVPNNTDDTEKIIDDL